MRHPTALEREFCVHLYSEGWLQKQLSFKFNRPMPTIRQWIKRAGAQRGHKFRVSDMTKDRKSNA